MLKLFGFSKKEKVNVKDLASVYSRTLFEVIDLGFSEIIEFVNDNRKFEESPNLKMDDANWFLMIVFAANNHCLPNFFDDHIVNRLHHASLNELIKFMDLEEDLVRDMFIDYENFFKEQYSEDITIEKAMAKSIFVKYNLNEYQGDLLKNQNEPNPAFLQELTDLMSNFIWNWSDYLGKYKLIED